MAYNIEKLKRLLPFHRAALRKAFRFFFVSGHKGNHSVSC